MTIFSRVLALVGVLIGGSLLGSSSCFAVAVTPMVGYGMGNGNLGGSSSTIGFFHTPVIGGGVTVEFDILRILKLETGGIYMPRGFIQSTDPTTEVTFTTIQFPLCLRLYLLRFFSIGFGAYFSYGFGTIQSNSSQLQYNDYSFGSNDYGPMASATLHIGVFKSVRAVFQGRLLLGLPDISQTPGLTASLWDIQAFAGLQFGN